MNIINGIKDESILLSEDQKPRAKTDQIAGLGKRLKCWPRIEPTLGNVKYL